MAVPNIGYIMIYIYRDRKKIYNPAFDDGCWMTKSHPFCPDKCGKVMFSTIKLDAPCFKTHPYHQSVGISPTNGERLERFLTTSFRTLMKHIWSAYVGIQAVICNDTFAYIRSLYNPLRHCLATGKPASNTTEHPRIWWKEYQHVLNEDVPLSIEIDGMNINIG